MNQRMMLLAEEIARVKYGKDNLLTDYEFNSLNESFQSKEEKKLYNRYKKADKIVNRGLVNLQGLSFNIRLNNSDLNSYILLSYNIGQSENIVNAVLSNIEDIKKRERIATFSIDFGKLGFSENSVDNDGYINFSLDTNNPKINLLELIDTLKKSLNYNLVRFKSWKRALTDYFNINNIDVKSYNEIIQNLTDTVKTNSIGIPYDEIKVNHVYYDEFTNHVLAG